MRKISCFLSLFLLIFCLSAEAQPKRSYTSAEILHKLKKLNTLGSVLYIAAHPDDENTRLIAYMANEEMMETAYLSITRGDGGQNLIGKEIREELGIIRTQELLAARRTDGGHQFFTRANDFGYSKHPDETFNIWDRERVLGDMVYVIRKWQPDVVITRFNTTPGTTHGHHTASAILAEEAIEAAADSKRFPEQLNVETKTWQVKKLLWNTSSWFYRGRDFNTDGLVKLDVGKYNPLLGKSYTEIAAESRTMHKSQGFGNTGSRGEQIEYLKPLKGEIIDSDIFKGLNTTWRRLEGGEQIMQLIQEAIQNFTPDSPHEIVPTLVDAYKKLSFLNPSFYKERKLAQLAEVIQACMGLYVDFNVSNYKATHGDSIMVQCEFVNRSPVPTKAKLVVFKGLNSNMELNIKLEQNQKYSLDHLIIVQPETPISQPYWLQEEGSLGMFSIPGKKFIGKPENDPALWAIIAMEIDGIQVNFEVPAVYKWNDPVNGESRRPFEVGLPAYVNLLDDVYLFTAEEPKTLQIKVTAGKDDVQGEVSLNLPEGWTSTPEKQGVSLANEGAEKFVEFTVKPPKGNSEGRVSAEIRMGDFKVNRGLKEIIYDHIPAQTLFPLAEAKIVKMDLQKKGQRVGYIEGAGDQIPEALQIMGYSVENIDLSNLNQINLNEFDAIVVGIRAYNTNDRLPVVQEKLMDYVAQGGTYIVQYNTSHRLKTNNLAPYDLKLSRDRVTVEEAEVRILNTKHPVFTSPNKITDKDFQNWVQERGLYFPDEWATEFEPLLSMNDPGETAKEGSLLVAKHGKGHYVYTGISFFRELPAGVPGAYRLFANLVSLGK